MANVKPAFLGHGPYMPSRKYRATRRPGRRAVWRSSWQSAKYSRFSRRGRYRKKRATYVTKKYRKRCRPLSSCTRKQVRQIVKYHLNQNTEMKYHSQVHAVPADDCVSGGSYANRAHQLFPLATIDAASGVLIPRITASETADLNSKRKGDSINLVNFEARFEFNAGEQIRKCKWFIYIISVKGNDEPNPEMLQPSTFLENFSLWKRDHIDNACLKIIYKRVVNQSSYRPITMVGAAAPTTAQPPTDNVYYDRQKRLVIKLNLKNKLIKATPDPSVHGQNSNLFMVVFPEYDGAGGGTPSSADRPTWDARTWLFYRDG